MYTEREEGMSKDKDAIVYVCAHPDDIASIAGTLYLLKDKYQLHDFCLTRGQHGHSPGPGIDTGEHRSGEEAAVCEILGAELQFFDQMDGELFADRELCERVAAEFARIKPAAVITLWPLEKPDHAAAAHIALKALTLADLYFTTEIYLRVSHETINRMGCPDIFVNISSVIEQKMAMARCHASQWDEKSFERMRNFAGFLGDMAWCDYAEGFKTVLPPVGERWDRPAEVGRILMDLNSDA
jgi:LmbE family N-acetylglucosaminyl deacetylase